MANEEHLEVLGKGVDVWNKWYREQKESAPNSFRAELRGVNLLGANLVRIDFSLADLSEADLSRAYLLEANLSGANLVGTNLSRSNFDKADFHAANLDSAILSEAEFIETNFKGAILTDAILQVSDLQGASLVNAQMYSTILYETDLTGTDFDGASFGDTSFASVDLSKVKGLSKTKHHGPSSIGIDTIYKSKGEIPHKFLREAGVPENLITYMSSLTGKAFEYFSAFISYTEADDTFSKRLYEGLQTAGLRVWRWREDAKWGAPIEKNIDQAVRIYDKLIVICSEASLKAPAVIDEIDRALQKEHALMKEGKTPEVLFPITIDDYIFDEWEHYLKPRIMAKTVGDFRSWEDPKKYDAALERLIAALRQEGNNGKS